MRLSDKVYDTIKIIQRWLPAIFLTYALIIELSGVWGWGLADYSNEVSKTINYITTFLAGLLELSSVTYKKDMLSTDVSVTKMIEEDNDDVSL